MALLYDDDPNGVLRPVGKCAKHFNLQKTDGQNLDTDQDDILDTFDAMTSGRPRDMIAGFPERVAGWREHIIGRREVLVALAERRFRDRETVLLELGVTVDDIQTILARFIDQMRIDSESVARNVVTIGSVTAASGNVGDGELVTTKTLDGVTSPGANPVGTIAAHADYSGRDSELSPASEALVIRCVDDDTEEDEAFSWDGEAQDSRYGLASNPGVGAIEASMTPINGAANNLLTGGRIATTTAWELVTGGPFPGGDIELQTITAPHVGIRFEATAASDQAVKQDVTDQLEPDKSYWLMVRIRASSTGPMATAGKKARVYVGTVAGTPIVSGDAIIEVTQGSFTTSFTLYSTLFVMPANITDDVFVWIDVDDDVDTGETIDFWDIALAPVQYGAGIGLGIIQGETTTFVKGDRFDLTVTNDRAGVIQSFFGDAWNVQLPSVASSETIADSLFT